MTVSYVRSPSFSGHNTFSDFYHASPPQSPIASCASSTTCPSPIVGHPSPRPAPRALSTSASPALEASGVVSVARSATQLASSTSPPIALGQSGDTTSFVVPNERMEAGLSLRRSPLLAANEFGSESSTYDSESSPSRDPESVDHRYEPALTGDIDLHDRFVYRRPYIDRAFPHSKRRSQLIFEQKFQQHRSSAANSEQDWTQATLSPSRPLRTRRPGTAPQRAPVSPHTPESAPGHWTSKAVATSPGGLRELSTGAAAQPASNRTFWIRRAREAEIYSESHHAPNSSLEAAAPIPLATLASRRHSSFLAGDYRSSTLMPVRASNSFEIHSIRGDKPRSYPSDQATRPAVASSTYLQHLTAADQAASTSSKRDSMQSTDSSATSSSKGEGRSVDIVEFEGDDVLNRAQSSASSGCGHEESPATNTTTWTSQSEAGADNKLAEVYTTPRTSAEDDKGLESSSSEPAIETNSNIGNESVRRQKADEPPEHVSEPQQGDVAHVEQDADYSTIAEPVPAPSMPPSTLGQIETAVLPPTPTAPDWIPPDAESVSPTSSPMQAFRSLHAADESANETLSSRSETSLESGPNTNPASPFGTLGVPSGKGNGSGHLLATGARRGSSASVASAASSTSTYRIRRKPVPSDADESERRPSATSGTYSDAPVSSPPRSPARSDSRALTEIGSDEVSTIHHERSASGSDFIRMAQEAAQARMLERDAIEGLSSRQIPAYLPTRSGKRPSTAAASTTTFALSGYGLAKQPQASASSRELSSLIALGNGTASTETAGAASPSATRTPSRATIKRPTTAPVGSGGQFRATSDAAQKSTLEVEGMHFVLGNAEAKKGKQLQDVSPSLPNAVRFLQHQRIGSDGAETVSTGKRDSLVDVKRKSGSIHDVNRSDGGSAKSLGTRNAAARNGTAGAATASSAGGWGLEQELKIVDRVRNPNVDAQTPNGPKARPASMDKSRKAQDAAAKANFKNNMLMNIINEDESDEVKAAAREAGIPEGSYAIHPPSMLQLFEASQCLVYNQQGQEVIFGDLFKKRRTLVCFLRHWWCGFCQQFAMSIRKIDPLPLKRANLDFVIVGQGDWHVIKAYREVMQVPYPMFADPKRNVYRALGMTLRTNEANPVCARPDYASMSMTKGILVAIKKGLFDMPIRNPGDMKLLGGDFILGPGLQCSFTHRMTTADGHMDLPRILAQAGCDLSLKTPKPMFTVEEKDARAAMLAGGNQIRRQTRSLGRTRGKKSSKPDAATLDASFSTTTGSLAAGSNAAGSTGSRVSRPSLWGRFPGRFSKSQASLPTSGSMADLSTDFGPIRGLAAGPRSASAMRKVSYDGRVRDSFETQQTDIEFESRATSFDTRGGRPSDVSAPAGMISPLNKAQSMSELRRRFEMGSAQAGLSGLRSKSRQESSAAKRSLESHLTVPANGRGSIPHSASSRSLRAAISNTAAAPAQPSLQSEQKEGSSQKGSKPIPTYQNNMAARPNGGASAAATGLGIDAAGDEVINGATDAPTADRSVDGGIAASKDVAAPKSMADLAAPGSFLMDLDVYDALSHRPLQKYQRKGRQGDSLFDSSLSPSQFSDGGFGQEAANADSDTEPSMSATQSPARSQRTAVSNSSSGGSLGPSSSFYSFNTFRGKTNLEHLVEADEEENETRQSLEHEHELGDGSGLGIAGFSHQGGDESDSEDDEEEENDEPIEFEDGRSGNF